MGTIHFKSIRQVIARCLLCLTALSIALPSSIAETLMLPDFLTTVGSEAFAGASADTLVIPERVMRLDSRAFADCPNLKEVYIFAADFEYSADIFEGCTNLERILVYSDALNVRDPFTGCGDVRIVHPETDKAEPEEEPEDVPNPIIETVISYAESQLGKPYKSKGGYKTDKPSGFDCSGLVYWCYYKVGIKLKDTPAKQASDNTYAKISSISSLVRGDVVCFKSDSSSACSHTGIYLGDGTFIHASSAGKGVITTSITKDYYKRNFLWGRRIVE